MNIFYSKDLIYFGDDLKNFENILLDSKNNKYNIYFNFNNIKNSLSNVKNIVLGNIDRINFENLYFYNANDFINIILDKPIYLPYNINLFINEGCFIGCNYCDNPNDIQTKLYYNDIISFLSKYHISDNINFNILGQGDPLFHPELFEILQFIKSFGGNVTFFTGGKSLLYCKDINKLNELVDEFKINISSSNYIVYNKIHKNKITKDDFDKLVNMFKIIASKSTFLTILTKDNIGDLFSFYKFVSGMNAFGIEIKKNVFYNENDVINKNVVKKIEKIIEAISRFSSDNNLNFATNIISGYNNYKKFLKIHELQKSILDEFVNLNIKKLNYDEINNFKGCYQFGNSLDITENKIISVCCHYYDGKVSDLFFDGKYYENNLFLQKFNNYKLNTPESCKKCPMPIDRYKNYLKYNFVKSL